MRGLLRERGQDANLAYQFLNGTDALLNTHLEAEDWERHFGRWKPPERVRAAA
ncbi:MAG: hypothetical protein ACO36F_10080 [Ilumatobacteraceae bacterium]